ncbi:MAG: DUF308 domain-containing protein [Oscillospiraceae bacterium]|nr:DUF308 domain-containing protein [Oscillospiraceae bacterium]
MNHQDQQVQGAFFENSLIEELPVCHRGGEAVPPVTIVEESSKDCVEVPLEQGYIPSQGAYHVPREPYERFYAPGAANSYVAQGQAPQGFYDPQHMQADPYGQSYGHLYGVPYEQCAPQIQGGPCYTAPMQAVPYGFRQPPQAKKSNKGIVSFVCSLVALALAYFIPIVSVMLGIIAIILGFEEFKNGKAEDKGRSLAILGLVFGILAVIVSVAIAVAALDKYLGLQKQINARKNIVSM